MKAFFVILFTYVFLNGFAQVDTVKWVRLSALPDSIQRLWPGSFLIDSNFYLIGGQIRSSGMYQGTMWRYCIPDDKWSQMSYVPFGAADAAASFVLNGKGYFLTSRDSVSSGDCDRMLWQYNPTIDQWSQKANFPDSPRQGSAYFTLGGFGYVGLTNGCTQNDNHFWKYNPISDQWISIADLPPPMMYGSSASAFTSNYAYLLGGFDNSFTMAYNSFWRYNIAMNVWDSMSPIPGAGRASSMVLCFDSLIIAGGGISTTQLFNDFYKYDIMSNTWSQIIFQNSFDSAATGISFTYKKRGYYFGGLSNWYPNDIYNNNLWSFDAAKFYSKDTTTGIIDIISNDISFKVYPNPLDKQKTLNVQCSEDGEIVFCDLLGRTTYQGVIHKGLNTFDCSQLAYNANVILYKAKMRSGKNETGKIVTIK